MKNNWIALIGCAVVLAGTSALRAENKNSPANPGTPALVAAEHLDVLGTVEDVGKLTRTATIKTDSGEKVKLKAGPELARFDELKEGDRVAVSYLGSVVVDVQKPNKPFVNADVKKYHVTGPGAPDDALVETQEIGVQVVDIDKGAHKLKVRAPDGKQMDLKADAVGVDLDKIQIGDQIVMRYTEAVALDIQPQNKK